MFSVARRTSVLVFFEGRIPQRDRDCKAGTEFIRSTVSVGKHTKKQFILARSRSYTLGEKECGHSCE